MGESAAWTLIGLAAAAWLWMEILRAREAALSRAKHACRSNGLQLLDQSVVCVSIRPARDSDGRLALRRIYRFEFSDDGMNRRGGSITMLGMRQESIRLDPFLDSVRDS